MRTYGLIGYPLTQSFSNKYFTEKFEKLGLKDHRHKIFPIDDIKKFPALIKDDPDLVGLNVTMPYKEAVIPFLDELDEVAKDVGAVNTIRVGKKLKGYNTDAYGFRQALKPFLQPQHHRALILGTGGASKAIAYVLKEIGIDFFYVTRKKKEAGNYFEYEELNENVMKAFKLIVNCTPVGMFPEINFAPPIPYQYLTRDHFCFDLIYNPADTLFMKKAKERGALTQNGHTMLIEQAEKAWEIWNQS